MEDNRNVIICGDYIERQKFEYIANNICPLYESVLYLPAGSNRNVLDEWERKKLIPKNMSVLNEDSSMIMEFFTIGGDDNNYGHQDCIFNKKWISQYNADYDALVVDKVGKQRGHDSLEYMSIFFWRMTGWWKIKPLYIFTKLSKEEAEQEYKDTADEIVRCVEQAVI